VPKIFLPIRHPVVEGGPLQSMTEPWRKWAEQVTTDVNAMTSLPAVINRKTYVELNALGLGAGDEGYLAFETTYGHLLRWTGTAWEFAPGSAGNKFRRDFLGAPQEVGWALMDGSATDYLTVGSATLTVTPITLPNLVGSSAFHKSASAYTGTIEAAVAPGISGETADVGTSGPPGSGAMDILGTQSDGTGGVNVVLLNSIWGHRHGAGSLAADSEARPPSIGWLPYFKR
jgi:hypothetical protein